MDAGLIRRYHITFYGDVQGVGFRWRARTAARSLGLTGWVKNEWDGTVVMEVQGYDPAIDRMLSQIDSGSFIRIERMQKFMIRPDPAEKSFSVAGY